jgi:Holliday junction DNA helicase RuvB
MLYIAMEDRELDWVIGQGPSARTMRIQLKPFTLIGATTKAGMVAAPLISRFGITCRFSFYEKKDMETIVNRSAAILQTRVEKPAAMLIASSARGTPRVANRLLKRMRDFAQVENAGLISEAVVRKGLEQLEIDELGLEKFDREILRLIIERYGGGPVGAETLAISIGESVDTLEDFYEPFLVQSGLLQRTPRGRMVTMTAYQHLNLKMHNENTGLLF